eukprot:12041569-Alexandrium_andersonii.AAC.1
MLACVRSQSCPPCGEESLHPYHGAGPAGGLSSSRVQSSRATSKENCVLYTVLGLMATRPRSSGCWTAIATGPGHTNDTVRRRTPSREDPLLKQSATSSTSIN